MYEALRPRKPNVCQPKTPPKSAKSARRDVAAAEALPPGCTPVERTKRKSQVKKPRQMDANVVPAQESENNDEAWTMVTNKKRTAEEETSAAGEQAYHMQKPDAEPKTRADAERARTVSDVKRTYVFHPDDIQYPEQIDELLQGFAHPDMTEEEYKKLLQEFEARASEVLTAAGADVEVMQRWRTAAGGDQDRVGEHKPGGLHRGAVRLNELQEMEAKELVRDRLLLELARQRINRAIFSRGQSRFECVAGSDELFRVHADVSLRVWKGDKLWCRRSETTSWHQGLVVERGSEKHTVRFDSDADFVGECDVDVFWIFNDSPYKMVVHILNDPSTVFVNGVTLGGMRGYSHRLPRVEKRFAHLLKMEPNEQQQQFIEGVCSGGQALHILHGPPGTGKTATVARTIAELLLRSTPFEPEAHNQDSAVVNKLYTDACGWDEQPSVRIMVACPSNAAADAVVERLVKDYAPLFAEVGTGRCRIVRVQADSRKEELVSDTVQRVSKAFPKSVYEVEQVDVLIVTLVQIGRLRRLGMDPYSFTHVFVDEAAQTTEHEMMLATSLLRPSGTTLVVAGDAVQLGPVVHSDSCHDSGASVSPMERWEALAGHENVNHVKLIDNYRCQPSLLNIVNAFYSDTLKARREEKFEPSSLVCDLVKKVHPRRDAIQDPAKYLESDWLGFFHVDGSEEHEHKSKSWKNEAEAEVVVLLLLALLDDYKPEEMGVITPYNLQKKALLRSYKRLSQGKECPVDVATVESFQGQERRIIIMSPVRHENLQFAGAAQRVNVSLSRSQDVLIVVGNVRRLWTGSPAWCKALRRFKADKAVLNWDDPEAPPEWLFPEED
eukprot:Hpha_TRINITY_DN16383_c0_g7::TRINITY_DN16383_c0_g7_i1::g.58503::m.58503/K18422/MOV10; helicase MOV-10